MSPIDAVVFVSYFGACVGLGIWVASRRRDKSSSGYFLAGKSLPWYVVGFSYIGTNLSTEHLIGMVGMGYLYGIALAAWEWNGVVTFSILAWIIIPLYYRKGFHTMPEFLEKRFGVGSRYAFALLTVCINVSGFLAAVLFAGGIALSSLFGWSLEAGVIALAVVAGVYTVYGGLVSVAWTDLFQVAVMLASGFLVLAIGLDRVGGWSVLLEQAPEHFELFLPRDHEALPWPGVLAVILSVNLWYTSTNQNMVQRLLGARSEWDAKMGIVLAGFIKVTTPFVIVVPGIIAFVLYPNLANSNAAYPTLIRELLPAGTGMFGLLMAAMTAAIMSSIDSVTHSTSTIISIDFYKRLFRPNATERQLVIVGRTACVVVLTTATVVACMIDETSRVFVLIQNLFGYIGPPAASVFITAIAWRRANGTAALMTLALGIPIAVIIERVIFPDIVFLYRMFVTWTICMAMMVVISLLTKAPDITRAAEFSWGPEYLKGGTRPEGGKWFQDWRLWWAIYAGVIGTMYIMFGTL